MRPSLVFLPAHETKKVRLINYLIKILAICCLLVSAISSALAQDLDMDCRPITLPTQCRSIRSQIDTIEAGYRGEINALEEELRHATFSERAFIRAEIRRLRREWANDQVLKQLKIELTKCRLLFDKTPRRPVAANVFDTSFVGNVETHTTRPLVEGPFNNRLNIGLQFSRDRCIVTVTSFPAITFTAQTNTPFGGVDVTISKTGGGTGNFFPVTGQITLPLNFSFHYDTIFAGDDTAATTLTTGNTISQRGAFNLTGVRFTSTNNAPVDQCGANVGGTQIVCTVKLVGTTIFQDGFLGGNEGSLTVRGTIGVPPPQPQPQPDPACLAVCQELFQDCINEGERPAQCAHRRSQCRARCSSTSRGTRGGPQPQPQPQPQPACLAICQELFRECISEDGRGAPTTAQCASRRDQCRARCPQ